MPSPSACMQIRFPGAAGPPSPLAGHPGSRTGVAVGKAPSSHPSASVTDISQDLRPIMMPAPPSSLRQRLSPLSLLCCPASGSTSSSSPLLSETFLPQSPPARPLVTTSRSPPAQDVSHMQVTGVPTPGLSVSTITSCPAAGGQPKLEAVDHHSSSTSSSLAGYALQAQPLSLGMRPHAPPLNRSMSSGRGCDSSLAPYLPLVPGHTPDLHRPELLMDEQQQRHQRSATRSLHRIATLLPDPCSGGGLGNSGTGAGEGGGMDPSPKCTRGVFSDQIGPTANTAAFHDCGVKDSRVPISHLCSELYRRASNGVDGNVLIGTRLRRSSLCMEPAPPLQAPSTERRRSLESRCPGSSTSFAQVSPFGDSGSTSPLSSPRHTVVRPFDPFSHACVQPTVHAIYEGRQQQRRHSYIAVQDSTTPFSEQSDRSSEGNHHSNHTIILNSDLASAYPAIKQSTPRARRFSSLIFETLPHHVDGADAASRTSSDSTKVAPTSALAPHSGTA